MTIPPVATEHGAEREKKLPRWVRDIITVLRAENARLFEENKSLSLAHEIPENQRFCPFCGCANLKVRSKCRECGAELP